MKQIFSLVLAITFILSINQTVHAYSYGDPGEEALAEAYNEIDNYLDQDDWENAKLVYDTYSKEFELYFTATKPVIEDAFEHKNKEQLLKAYQAALRLNIERRLHFAEDQFEDYGQAKLLLAKARGTFSVLEPITEEKTSPEFVSSIYSALDEALVSLGNPGLFGIGNKESDSDVFKENIEFIISELKPLYPIPEINDEGDAHLTEENLDFMDQFGEVGSSNFWLWFSVALFGILIVIVIVQKRKKNR